MTQFWSQSATATHLSGIVFHWIFSRVDHLKLRFCSKGGQLTAVGALERQVFCPFRLLSSFLAYINILGLLSHQNRSTQCWRTWLLGHHWVIYGQNAYRSSRIIRLQMIASICGCVVIDRLIVDWKRKVVLLPWYYRMILSLAPLVGPDSSKVWKVWGFWR